MNKHTPSSPIKIERQWPHLSTTQRRKAVLEYYRTNLASTIVRNAHTGLKVQFSMNTGGRKLANGGALYADKAEAVHMLPWLVQTSRYNNFGPPKSTDGTLVLGFLNLLAGAFIGGQYARFRINLLLRTDGVFYYNHEVVKQTTGQKNKEPGP